MLFFVVRQSAAALFLNDHAVHETKMCIMEIVQDRSISKNINEEKVTRILFVLSQLLTYKTCVKLKKKMNPSWH